MDKAARARELSASLESGEGNNEVFKEALELARSCERLHERLCVAMVKGWKESEECHQLLHALGPELALTAIHSSMSAGRYQAAQWLCGEVSSLLPQLSHMFFSQCSSPKLTAFQETLVGIVSRLPDVIANRMAFDTPPSLLPAAYFTAVGGGVVGCLHHVYQALKDGKDCSLTFPAAVTSKAVALGHKDELFSEIVPSLVQLAHSDPLWRRIAQSFFARIPANSFELVVDALLCYCPPSLQPPAPLYSLLGDSPTSISQGQFLFAHKLFLYKVPSSSSAMFTLIGYLTSSSALRQLLIQALKASLEVWSNASALRHMDILQHLWISKLIVLGVTCLSDDELSPWKPTLLKLLLEGVQAHISSPLDSLRQIGMAVGESLMNRFHSSVSDKHKLKFEYEPSPDTKAVLQLARDVSEQEAELKESREKTSCDKQPRPLSPPRERHDGMVQTSMVDESDSDDDLIPYSMTFDPNVSEPKPPRYLRTLLQGLLSTEDSQTHEAALRTADTLIRSQPPDLPEVCVELLKVLLHITNTFALTDFVQLRLKAMISLVATCPTPCAQYLTTEFYSPNYTIQQRLDILEVLTVAAQELATPTPAVLRGKKAESVWEEVVREKIKLKTRIISKGPQSPRAAPSPNRFGPVAAVFFFPLMVRYDHPLNTLDLLGQDSLVLGRLLDALGTMIYCAAHTPICPAMSCALLDFLWALRYHQSQYVRQAVLRALGMTMAASHTLWAEKESALTEALYWVKDVCDNDADVQCRTLAQHTLALLHASLSEAQHVMS